MLRLTFKQIENQQDYKEVYLAQNYCGTVSSISINDLKRLKSLLQKTKTIQTALKLIMSRKDPRPLGGYAFEEQVKSWLVENGSFGKHLWFDSAKGICWSPAAWSVCLKIASHK